MGTDKESDLEKERIKNLVSRGEGLNIEFKTCRNNLNRDVYETVCAFLNRAGGTLLLGVNDDGEITGVESDSVEQIKKNFVNTVNNPEKINPPCYLPVEEIEIEGKTVLNIYVPESSQVHWNNRKIFDRNEDGDFDITSNTNLVAELYIRKQQTYSENEIFPYAGLSDLDSALIARCRKMAVLRIDSHPWGEMDDLELLKSAQLFQTDKKTGVSGITLAGILLLGKRDTVLTAVPHHRTDLILRKVNLDRYDDRDFVDVNLVESYDRIIAFIQKHLPDPFYLEGDTRISIRDIIFREVASNILIHREYRNAFPAKLIIEYGQVKTENSNKAHGAGLLNPASFTPYPKNPVISAFFRQIGRADELGSGMRKLMKYGRAYGKEDPQMIEGDIFRIVVKVPEFSAEEPENPPITPQAPSKYPPSTPQVIQLVKIVDGEMSREQMMKKLSKTDRKNFRINYIKPALEDGLVEMTNPENPNSPDQKYRLTEEGRKVASQSGIGKNGREK